MLPLPKKGSKDPNSLTTTSVTRISAVTFLFYGDRGSLRTLKHSLICSYLSLRRNVHKMLSIPPFVLHDYDSGVLEIRRIVQGKADSYPISCLWVHGEIVK